MALDNGFDQLARGAVLGLPDYPDGFFPAVPDAPLVVAGADSGGFPNPAPDHFPNTHCIWGIDMFKQLPDVAERSYENAAAADSSNLLPKNIVATITAGTALSDAIDLGDGILTAIHMPAAWTAATLTFQVSDDSGTTWSELRNTAGVAVTVAAAAAAIRLEVDTTAFKSTAFLKVRSGTSATPVNQAADRVLTLVTRKFYPAD
jgi:hypothetical protein